MITRVAGIDPSCTATGVVVLQEPEEDGKPVMVCTQRVLRFPRVTGIERAVEQAKALDQILAELGADLAVFEGYAFTSGRTRLVSMAEVGTCLRVSCWRREVPWLVAAPLQLKKWVLGTGDTRKKLTKEKVAAGVRRLWGFEHADDNVVDAYALARLALAIKGADPRKLTLPQLEVMAKVRGPVKS